MFIDSHAHLDAPDFDLDRSEVQRVDSFTNGLEIPGHRNFL